MLIAAYGVAERARLVHLEQAALGHEHAYEHVEDEYDDEAHDDHEVLHEADVVEVRDADELVVGKAVVGHHPHVLERVVLVLEVVRPLVFIAAIIALVAVRVSVFVYVFVVVAIGVDVVVDGAGVAWIGIGMQFELLIALFLMLRSPDVYDFLVAVGGHGLGSDDRGRGARRSDAAAVRPRRAQHFDLLAARVAHGEEGGHERAARRRRRRRRLVRRELHLT